MAAPSVKRYRIETRHLGHDALAIARLVAKVRNKGGTDIKVEPGYFVSYARREG